MKTKKNLVNALKKLVLNSGGKVNSNNAVDLIDELGKVSGAFIINATGGVFDNPVSYNDIISAISTGKNVVLRNVKNDLATYLPLKTVKQDGLVVEFDYETAIYSAESPDNPLTIKK